MVRYPVFGSPNRCNFAGFTLVLFYFFYKGNQGLDGHGLRPEARRVSCLGRISYGRDDPLRAADKAPNNRAGGAAELVKAGEVAAVLMLPRDQAHYIGAVSKVT